MEISNENVLTVAESILEYMPELFDNKAILYLSNTEKVLKVSGNTSLPINISVGYAIPDSVKHIINTGVPETHDIDKNKYGIPLKEYIIPIKSSGKIIGAITSVKTVEAKVKILGLSENLADSISNISAAIQESTANIQTLSENSKGILLNVNKATENTKNSGSVLKFVQDVAKQTNLLGLNASIEAARAGEAGKGFSVVAQEIRKLSNSTSDSIKQINDVLNNIEQSVEEIADKIKSSNESFDTQAASFEEISASVQEINSNAKTVEEAAKTL